MMSTSLVAACQAAELVVTPPVLSLGTLTLISRFSTQCGLLETNQSAEETCLVTGSARSDVSSASGCVKTEVSEGDVTEHEAKVQKATEDLIGEIPEEERRD